MEFRVLGDIEALADGGLVDLGHLRQRSVLVALLLEANRIVSVDQLVDRVWAQRPPHRAKDTLYGYLHRLRKALADIEDVTIVRQPGGYSIAVDETRIDLYRFRELLRQARAAGEDSVAVALFEQALSLWRGDAFAGVDTPWVNGVRDTLQKERVAAQLDHIDLRLRQGEHTELVTELVTLAGEHRWDERLAGQLMLALYRSGRQADALAHYERTRTALAEELGLDPGPELRRLHQQILTADPAMTAPAGASVRVPAPRQLPAAPRLFTGRKDELAQLTKTVDASGNQGGVMVISAIGGSGGIGKTWPALCWAHQNSARFPDGQLYVNLNGFDPTGEPLSPAVALRGFLEALGIGSAAIPLDPQARAGLYRSLVADRRMLIVLDNARDTAQVAPLLPGDGGCVVLVTSRNRMEGLVTAHGAVPLALDALTEDEARRLLVRHVGQERVAAEPDATSELLKRCSGLPLAIGIVAARAVTTPTLSLSALAEELRDPSARLDTMSTGELANLREVFFGSYHALTNDAARLFRLLGLAQLPEVGVGAAASLVGMPVSGVRGLLRELEVAHLVQQHTSGRYRMHDLVRLYAHERAQHEEPDHTGALRRLADFYLHTAHAGDRLLHPNRPHGTLDPPVAGCAPEPFADAAAARSWFDSEHACLTIVKRQAAQHGWDTVVWQLAWSATGFRLRRGHFHDNITAWQAAITAADRAGSPAMQATARLNLG